jgi:hypothetical protein
MDQAISQYSYIVEFSMPRFEEAKYSLRILEIFGVTERKMRTPSIKGPLQSSHHLFERPKA